MTLRMRSKAQSISSRVIVSGGAMRMTCSCVSLQSSPSARSASHAGRAGPVSSMPIQRPRPRTVFSVGPFIVRSFARK